MEEVIQHKKSAFIFGNEAVARGALEAGVGFVTNYPGTPATEIGDTFAKISKETGVYFEYSTNEKVALEASAGAAFSGVKSMVVMKHYGLNVALDSLLPLVYLECPLVVVIADDPGCSSSVQTEQDSRYFSKLGHLPTMEPANPREAKEMTKSAFAISQNYRIPVLIRLTTRVSYSKEVVEFGKIPEIKTKGEFIKNPQGFKLGSSQTVALHQKTLEKIAKIQKEISENQRFNFIQNGKGNLGMVVSGVSYDYLQEIIKKLELNLPILKIGMSHPFPDEMARQFLKNLEQILVIEETEPVLEDELKRVAKEQSLAVKILGKDILPRQGELGPEEIEIALAKLGGRQISRDLAENIAKFKNLKGPARIPFWCPGCPHRETFKAVKAALGPDVIFGGDIGCYMLGAYPPVQMLDFVVSMGAGAGIAYGLSKTNNKKPVAFIGDSTFFHAGMPALLNMVFNRANILLIILDNRCTAMTGQQPHPGTGFTATGEGTELILIEEIAKALGADFVETIDVYKPQEAVSKIKELYSKDGVSVIVARGECVLFRKKRLKNSRGGG